MIAYLKGQIIWNKGNKVILNVDNIGYLIELTDPSLVNGSDRELELYIYTYVREDVLDLYGFRNLEERELFITLLGVSGIGPKAGLKILSTLSYDKFVDAIITENVSTLKQIPGVGLKTAQRLILELKNKMKELASNYEIDVNNQVYDEDLYNALTGLGYTSTEIDKAIQDLKIDSSTMIEEKLKMVLSYLGKER